MKPLPLAIGPFMPEQASTFAGRVDALYYFLVAVAFFFTALIFLLIFYCAIKYRRRSPDETGEPPATSNKIEATWIAGIFLLEAVMFVWGASVYVSMYSAPEGTLQIHVIGKQWMWRFYHPDGRREINELHVPAGRKVRLVIATDDVIHSFYVPAFRIKFDAVPGRYTTTWFQATRPGRYHLFCAEYCGTGHSRMRGTVIVMEPRDYQAWLGSGRAEGSPASEGEKLFLALGCASCHRSDVQGRGPMLQGLFGKQVLLETGETVVADESYIRESILDPRARVVAGFKPLMPSFRGIVTEEQLLQLVAYIKSLSGEERPPISGMAPQITGSAAPAGVETRPTRRGK